MLPSQLIVLFISAFASKVTTQDDIELVNHNNNNPIFLTTLMQRQSRLLPHLNSLFIQRQAYNSHVRKIQQIRSHKSKPILQLSVSAQRSSNASPRGDNARAGSVDQSSSASRLSGGKLGSSQSVREWRSPFQKRKLEEDRRENLRLRMRIKTCTSDVAPENLSKEYDKWHRIKQRLMKYETNPETQKSMLKCEASLNVLSPKLSISSSVARVRTQAHASDNPTESNSRYRRQWNYNVYKRRATELRSFLNKSALDSKPINVAVHQSRSSKLQPARALLNRSSQAAKLPVKQLNYIKVNSQLVIKKRPSELIHPVGAPSSFCLTQVEM